MTQYTNNPVFNENHIFGSSTIRRDVLESILGTRIRDPSLYTEALCHKSGLRVYGLTQSFERLEFIGDSVLNLVSTRYIYDRFPFEQEGFLTRLRTKMVNGKTLAQFGAMMGLQNIILMDHKAYHKGWNHSPKILEDVFEAFLGAIYLDLGYEAAKRFIHQFIETLDFDGMMQENNFKDVLMRYCQAQSLDLPKYESEILPTKEFRATVSIFTDTWNQYGAGVGKCKKDAEQEAAKQALCVLKVDQSQLKRR